MDKRTVILLICLAAAPAIFGCAGRNAVDTRYLDVDYTDRINIDEAKIIAKKELLNLGQQYYYRLTAPHVILDARTQAKPDLWFVSFDPKAVSKAVYGNYLVVIEKETGKIVFSSAYDPRKENGFDWALHSRKALPENKP